MVATERLEIFRHSLVSIVEEMGLTLQRTAYSTNIKTRRDHTCALFDAQLRHVAQHDIAPQHIGSLVQVIPEFVERRRGDLEAGDGFLINDPDQGAVHLPDVMLISPIHYEGELVGVAANSAHHVDIGGPTPGGVPNDSTELYGEGIVIPGTKAVTNWEYDEEIIEFVTRNVRDAEMRLGDYHAQLAANKTGSRRFSELLDEYGPAATDEYIDELLDYTERRVRAAIEDLPNGTYAAEDDMDGDGITDEPVPVAITITIDGDELTVDFTGSAEQNRGPLNCTPSMAFAGVMCPIMSLIGADFPKNDGFYRPIEVVTPEGTMVNPGENAPVAGGWEVAIRAGDLVTKAMADPMPEDTIAATKGTIVNLAYSGTAPDGDDYVYYETVGGGYGAHNEKDGMDGVQAHLQNTANSPIEELESDLPVYVRRYQLVEDSGGPGRTRGGLGIRRDIEFYGEQPVFSVLADRTKSEPWGLFDGKAGRPATFVYDPEGPDRTVLESKSTTELAPNDVVSIQTPGGGGYGDPFERDPEQVRRDVRNDKVSIGSAREDYGVAIERGPDGPTVDEQATVQLRETDGKEGAVDQ